MRVFGLTGGIASGKSTVAARFVERGVPVVFADQLARDAVAKGSPGLERVVAAFGPELLTSEGELDRKRLGRIVFDDASARATLNAIVHPEVARLAMEAFARLGAEGHALVCYEVPLLVENGLAPMFRPVVVVACPEAVQLSRLVDRDGLSIEEARARIAAQSSLDAKLAVADVVIHNDADREALLARADAALESVRRWLESPPGDR